MASKHMDLKLLVHNETNQVVFAESENDFVDVLLSFLTTPMGTMVRLTGNQPKLGSMSTLYESVKDLHVREPVRDGLLEERVAPAQKRF